MEILQDLIRKRFATKFSAIAVVMETSSCYGGSEDDRARERCMISVIGSPNGSESVSGAASPQSRYKQIDWSFVGSWTGIWEVEVMKHCEEIMVTCFRVAGGVLEFQFPPPTTKKIGPYPRKSVFVYNMYFIGLFL